MWNKPWRMKEGFLIGGTLVILGLLLQLIVGPVAWSAFRWPVNGIVFGSFLLLIAIVHLLRNKVYGFQFIGICCPAHHRDGSDAPDGRRCLAEPHADVLALRTGLCVCRPYFGTHYPPTNAQLSPLTSHLEKGRPFSLEPPRSLPCYDSSHAG